MLDKKKLLMLLLACFISTIPIVCATTQEFEYYKETETGGYAVYYGHYGAQIFSPRDTFNVSIIRLRVSKVGTPTTLHIHISPVISNKPAASVYSTGYIACGAWGSSTWVNISMGTYQLVQDQVYCIAVYVTGGDASNYINWRGTPTGGSYDRGSFCYTYDSGSSWTIVSAEDLNFIVYGETSPPPTPITLNIMNLPAILQAAFSLPSLLAAQLMMSGITMFALLLPVVILSKRPNSAAMITVVVIGTGALVAISWLPYWFMLLIILAIVGMFASKIADALAR